MPLSVHDMQVSGSMFMNAEHDTPSLLRHSGFNAEFNIGAGNAPFATPGMSPSFPANLPLPALSQLCGDPEYGAGLDAYAMSTAVASQQAKLAQMLSACQGNLAHDRLSGMGYAPRIPQHQIGGLNVGDVSQLVQLMNHEPQAFGNNQILLGLVNLLVQQLQQQKTMV